MKIAWNAAGTRRFEAGVDHGVLYFFDERTSYPAAVPWNGLTSVEDESTSSDTESLFLDGVKYLNRRKASNYAGKLSAFTYPEEFEQFLGITNSDNGIDFQNQEVTDTFDLSYRTLLGNDLLSTGAGYKLHLLYNLTASMAGISSQTIGESIDPKNFTWDLTSVPVQFEGFRPTSHVIINSTKIAPSVLADIEKIVYGTTTTTPRLPTPTDFNRWG